MTTFRKNAQFDRRAAAGKAVSHATAFEITISEHGVLLRFDSPRPSAQAKFKAEVVRVGQNGTREGFKHAQQLVAALPQLRHL